MNEQIDKEAYNQTFWERRRSHAERSAKECVPILMEMLRPTSVVDIGCGQGHWLAEFERCGVQNVHGVDGNYVLRDKQLLISTTNFQSHDLTEPLTVSRSFSLALCLEVAEHLPSRSASGLVSELVRLAPVVAFSAAIPNQGGVGHVNEQWPWYWQDHFALNHFVQLDVIRPRIWKNTKIAPWYRQNMFLYASQEVANDLLSRYGDSNGDDLTLVSRAVLESLSQPSEDWHPIRRIRHLVRKLLGRNR